MTSELRFSEVSRAYNGHIANLNRSREVFESEVRAVNDLVLEHLADTKGRPPEGIQKLRWRAIEDRSKSRDVTWINFKTGASIRLDIRRPELARYKRGAAFLHFETVYDEDKAEFVFRCRLENQNTVHDEIDERVMGLIEKRGLDGFPGCKHIKRNTAIIFRQPLVDELLDELNHHIDTAVGLVETAVDEIFPDSEYANTPVSSNDDADDDMDMDDDE
jgi:hypothetical protein